MTKLSHAGIACLVVAACAQRTNDAQDAAASAAPVDAGAVARRRQAENCSSILAQTVVRAAPGVAVFPGATPGKSYLVLAVDFGPSMFGPQSGDTYAVTCSAGRNGLREERVRGTKDLRVLVAEDPGGDLRDTPLWCEYMRLAVDGDSMRWVRQPGAYEAALRGDQPACWLRGTDGDGPEIPVVEVPTPDGRPIEDWLRSKALLKP